MKRGFCSCSIASEEPCAYCEAEAELWNDETEEMEDEGDLEDQLDYAMDRAFSPRDPRGDGPKHYVPPGER